MKSQRDLMRELIRRFGSDADHIISEYAAAEEHPPVDGVGPKPPCVIKRRNSIGVALTPDFAPLQAARSRAADPNKGEECGNRSQEQAMTCSASVRMQTASAVSRIEECIAPFRRRAEQLCQLCFLNCWGIQRSRHRSKHRPQVSHRRGAIAPTCT